MNIAKSIHETAMEYSLLADMAIAKGKPEESKIAFFVAFLLEKKAALEVKEHDIESKFILIRSAASLAYKAGLYSESLKLIHHCKEENPPHWIMKDLDEIKDLVAKKHGSIKEHLQLEGIVTDINTKKSQVVLKNEFSQTEFSIIIPPELLKTVVQDYWTKKVQIQAKVTDAGLIILEQIRQVA